MDGMVSSKFVEVYLITFMISHVRTFCAHRVVGRDNYPSGNVFLLP